MKLLIKEKLIGAIPWFIGTTIILTVVLLIYRISDDEKVGEILNTVFATFIGATAAFSLEKWNQRRLIRENQIVAGNKAIFALGQIYSFYVTYKKQIVDPACATPFPWLTMKPSVIGPRDKVGFELDSLYYILETKAPDILGRLYIEEQRFHTMLESIRKRDIIIENRLRPKLEELGIVENTILTAEAISKVEQALGPDLRIACKGLTDEIIIILNQNIASITRIQKDLVALLQDKFRSTKLIRQEFIAPEDLH